MVKKGWPGCWESRICEYFLVRKKKSGGFVKIEGINLEEDSESVEGES